MARPTRSAALAAEAVAPGDTDHSATAALDELAIRTDAVLAVSEVLINVGRMQAAHAISNLSRMAALTAFEQIRAAGGWKGVPYITAEGKVTQCETLEEFCPVFLRRPLRSLQEDAQNMRLVGPEVYEQLDEQGFTRAQFRALRALPDAERPALEAALAAPDPETRLQRTLAILEKTQTEKEAAEKAASEAQAQVATKDKLLVDRAKRIDALELKVELRAKLPEAARQQDLEERYAQSVLDACVGLEGLAAAIGEIHAQVDRPNERLRLAMQQGLARVAATLFDIASEHGVAADFADALRLDWFEDHPRPPAA